MKQTTIISVLAALIVGGVGFFIGMKYQQSKPSQFGQQFRTTMAAGANNGSRQAGIRNGGGQIVGTILSLDATSMTVKLADGSSKIILLSDTTTFAKEATGSVADIKVGDRIGTFGSVNADGSVTAQTVQINPVMRGPGTNTPGQTQTK